MSRKDKPVKQLLVVKPDMLSYRDKVRLSKNGIVVIEHPNPDEIRLIHFTDGCDSNYLLSAAINAIDTATNDDVRLKFSKAITKQYLESNPLPSSNI